MKDKIISLFMGLGIICSVQLANAREFKEHISKEFILSKDVTGSTLFIYNVSGFIKVEGYEGNNVLLEIDKTITADDDKILETGKQEFRLAFDQKSIVLLHTLPNLSIRDRTGTNIVIMIAKLNMISC